MFPPSQVIFCWLLSRVPCPSSDPGSCLVTAPVNTNNPDILTITQIWDIPGLPLASVLFYDQVFPVRGSKFVCIRYLSRPRLTCAPPGQISSSVSTTPTPARTMATLGAELRWWRYHARVTINDNCSTVHPALVSDYFVIKYCINRWNLLINCEKVFARDWPWTSAALWAAGGSIQLRNGRYNYWKS